MGAGVSGVLTLGCGGQLLVPMSWQGPVADIHVMVGARADYGLTETVEALTVGMLSCGCPCLHQVCTLQWRPVIGVRLGACRCTAGNAGYK